MPFAVFLRMQRPGRKTGSGEEWPRFLDPAGRARPSHPTSSFKTPKQLLPPPIKVKSSFAITLVLKQNVKWLLMFATEIAALMASRNVAAPPLAARARSASGGRRRGRTRGSRAPASSGLAGSERAAVAGLRGGTDPTPGRHLPWACSSGLLMPRRAGRLGSHLLPAPAS